MKKINPKIFIFLFSIIFIIAFPFVIKEIASDKTIGQNQELTETTQQMPTSEETTSTTKNKTDYNKFETTKPSGKPIFTTSDKSYLDDALFIGDSRTVDTHIKRLRKKIGDDYIQTVRGFGYKFEG